MFSRVQSLINAGHSASQLLPRSSLVISFNSARHYHEIKIVCTISAKSLVSRPSGTLKFLISPAAGE